MMVPTHGLTSQKLRRFVVARAMPSPTYFRLFLLLVEPLPPRFENSICVIIIKKASAMGGFFYDGADTRTRTADPLITNQ